MEILRKVLRSIGYSLPRTPLRALISLVFRRFLVRVRGIRFRLRPASDVPPVLLARIDACRVVGAGLGIVDPVRAADFNSRSLLLALRAGEPARLAEALAYEALHTSIAGTFDHDRTRTLLETLDRVTERHLVNESRGYRESARGVCAYYLGDFAAALGHLALAESIWREECHGKAFEASSVRMYQALALVYLGHVDQLARRVPQWLGEAVRTGDLFGATNVRLSFMNLAWLVGDDVDGAWAMVRKAVGDWSQRGFLVQHWYALTAETHLHLYEGKAAEAQRSITEKWKELSKSLLLRVQLVRVEAHQLRARCAAALAVAEPDAAPALHRIVESAAERLCKERIPWAVAQADLVRAAVAAQRGDDARAEQLLRSAMKVFDETGLGLYAEVTRARLGELIGGAEGEELRSCSVAWSTAQGIKAPEKWVRLFAPGFPERRAK